MSNLNIKGLGELTWPKDKWRGTLLMNGRKEELKRRLDIKGLNELTWPKDKWNGTLLIDGVKKELERKKKWFENKQLIAIMVVIVILLVSGTVFFIDRYIKEKRALEQEQKRIQAEQAEERRKAEEMRIRIDNAYENLPRELKDDLVLRPLAAVALSESAFFTDEPKLSQMEFTFDSGLNKNGAWKLLPSYLDEPQNYVDARSAKEAVVEYMSRFAFKENESDESLFVVEMGKKDFDVFNSSILQRINGKSAFPEAGQRTSEQSKDKIKDTLRKAFSEGKNDLLFIFSTNSSALYYMVIVGAEHGSSYKGRYCTIGDGMRKINYKEIEKCLNNQSHFYERGGFSLQKVEKTQKIELIIKLSQPVKKRDSISCYEAFAEELFKLK